MERRTLGRSGIEIGALGLGCWAIGGPAWRDKNPIGWGAVDDDESIRAIHKALDLEVNFFDTADIYGCGHSETVLGKALDGVRDDVVIATKFGNSFDETTRKATGHSSDPDYIRSACEESLRRLKTDRIDLYQFHQAMNDHGEEVRETLEGLVEEGKIRYYGWSTDDPGRARIFGKGEHCTAVQQHLNVFGGSMETLEVCEELDLACINRGPLGMGLLTGKFHAESTFPDDDIRKGWDFRTGPHAENLKRLEKIRDVLTSEGRTPAQGALCWLWARSANTIPIPGFKTVAQVEENCKALKFDPLSKEQMEEIDAILQG